MKAIMIFCFIFISCLSSYPSEILKVLILPFKNNSIEPHNEIYSSMIQETIGTNLSKLPSKIEKNEFETNILKKIKNDSERLLLLSFYHLGVFGEYYVRSLDVDRDIAMEDLKKIEGIFKDVKYKRFIPIMLRDFGGEDNITDYKDIYTKAFFNGIDLIIYGFYFVDKNRIIVTFKILDVISERTKVVYTKTGAGGYEAFDVILDSAGEFTQKIFDKVNAYPEGISLRLRDKQARLISGDENETFIFFNMGAIYEGGGFINKYDYRADGVNLQSNSNIYTNSVNPSFDFEIYGNYKNNYYGFGFSFVLPFIYFIPNLHMNTNFSFNFLFGYRKEFFFSWGLRVYYIGFDKYAKNLNNELQVFYMGLGLSFLFKYLPRKYPFYIEAGFTLVPPKFPYNTEEQGNSGPALWNISTGKINPKSWIFPVFFQFGCGYFFKEDTGIYIRNSIKFMNICYEKHDFYKNEDIILGEDFSIFYTIEIGIVIKGVFK